MFGLASSSAVNGAKRKNPRVLTAVFAQHGVTPSHADVGGLGSLGSATWARPTVPLR